METMKTNVSWGDIIEINECDLLEQAVANAYDICKDIKLFEAIHMEEDESGIFFRTQPYFQV